MAYPEFLDLQTAVYAQDYGTGENTDIELWLNMAYFDVCNRHRWPWLFDTITVTTVASTRTVAMGATVAEVLQINPKTSDEVALEWVDPNDLDENTPFREYDVTEGVPTKFTIRENLWYFDPIPDKVYTYDASIMLLPTAMSLDTDEPLMPTGERFVLVDGALKYASIRDRDANRTGYHSAEFERQIEEMWTNVTMGNAATQQISRVPMPGHYHGLYDG